MALIPELPQGTNFPVAGQELTSTHYGVRDTVVSDYFLVDDQAATFGEASGRAYLGIYSLNEAGPELAEGDRGSANPIARPEIEVSRLNARHIAFSPSLAHNSSVDGQGLLGSDGKPRRVRLKDADYVAWTEDPTLERRLIADYLMRDHAFRMGGDGGKPFRTSAVRSPQPPDEQLTSPGDLNALLRAADPGFGSSVSVDSASLLDYLNWLTTPAVLRAVSAHSTEYSSQFGPSTAAALNAQFGGKVWYWNIRQDAIGYFAEPSLGQGPYLDARDYADFFVYLSLWENRILETAGQAFYLHDGCTVNSVSAFEPYSVPGYPAFQHAESLLFYANGLGLEARSKVFNDLPRKFGETISETQRFASSLAGYYSADSHDATLNPNGATNWADRRTRTLQRKRTYFWGLLGDPTLRLRY